jgi:hypothetical protein
LIHSILIYQILYISDLSDDTTAAQISEVLTSARTRNAERNITGVLLFDGAHFVQLLEGEKDDVESLMRAIDADTRHCNVFILHSGLSKVRRFFNFGAGYWYVDEEEESAALLRTLSGAQALEAVLARRAAFDIAR